MLKAVIDTNLFVSGMINPRGLPSRLLIRWRAGDFELLLSDQQYAEIRDVFGRSKIIWKYQITPRTLADFYAELDFATRVISLSTVPVPVRDPKDERILASAMGGNADCLVTGDNDLLVLRGDVGLGNLKIVTVTEFLGLLDDNDAEDQT